jgi:hypothetical protein
MSSAFNALLAKLLDPCGVDFRDLLTVSSVRSFAVMISGHFAVT